LLFDNLGTNGVETSRLGISVLSELGDGGGVSLVWTGGQLSFLNDGVGWGTSYSFPSPPTTGQTWRFLAYYDGAGNFYGSAWQVGASQPSSWQVSFFVAPDSSHIYAGITGDSAGFGALANWTNFLAYTSNLELIQTSDSSAVVIVESLSVSDSVIVSDSVGVGIVTNPSVSDSTTVTESVAVSITSYISTTDSVIVTESPKLDSVDLVSVSDSVSVSETVSVTPPIANISVSDSSTVTETLILNPSFRGSINETETVSVTEYINLVVYTDYYIPVNVVLPTGGVDIVLEYKNYNIVLPTNDESVALDNTEVNIVLRAYNHGVSIVLQGEV
jgi:hypothetical protein